MLEYIASVWISLQRYVGSGVGIGRLGRLMGSIRMTGGQGSPGAGYQGFIGAWEVGAQGSGLRGLGVWVSIAPDPKSWGLRSSSPAMEGVQGSGMQK